MAGDAKHRGARERAVAEIEKHAEQDASRALDWLQAEIDRYHSFAAGSGEAQTLAEWFSESLDISRNEVSLYCTEVDCNLAVTYECDDLEYYSDLSDVRPGYAELGYGIVVTVRVLGLAEKAHPLFINASRIASSVP